MRFIFRFALPAVVFILSSSAALHAAPPKGEQSTPGEGTSSWIWNDPDKMADLKDILFEFDTHESAAEQAVLEQNARWLKDHPDVRFKIAGYTDVRGDIVYNLALSQRRAATVKQELVRLGIAEDRIIFATGWGELYPNCGDSNEECWARQRRVEFVRAIE